MIVAVNHRAAMYGLLALVGARQRFDLRGGQLRRHFAVAGPVPEPQPAATEKAVPVRSAGANGADR